MVIVNDVSNKVNFTGKIYHHKYLVFLKDNMIHKYYGPARIWDGNKDWWFNNKLYGRSDDGYNQKQFLKDLNKQWLL